MKMWISYVVLRIIARNLLDPNLREQDFPETVTAAALTWHRPFASPQYINIRLFFPVE
jgi:hypothetical protein